jgi:serine protease Do
VNNDQGVLVSAVTPGSAAAAGGLQSGDVIVAFNGQPVQDATQLKLRVAQAGPGASVPVVVMREGQQKSLTVTLNEESNKELANANSQNNQGGIRSQLRQSLGTEYPGYCSRRFDH